MTSGTTKYYIEDGGHRLALEYSTYDKAVRVVESQVKRHNGKRFVIVEITTIINTIPIGKF